MHTHSSTYYLNPNKPSYLLSVGHAQICCFQNSDSKFNSGFNPARYPEAMTFPEHANILIRRAQYLKELAMKEHFTELVRLEKPLR